MKFYMNEIQTPIYLNSNFIYNPTAFSLSHYKERSIFQSNVIEYWAPITDLIIPGIAPGRYFVSSWGNTWNTYTQSPIGLSLHKKGYWQIQMATKTLDGSYLPITRKIHVLIMKTFCWFPECDNYIINHMDSNKQNNNLYNLEWCTESENTIHAIKNNKKTIFGADYTVNITDEQVGLIYNLYWNNKLSFNDIRKIIGINVSESLMSNICHKRARIAYFKKNGLL